MLYFSKEELTINAVRRNYMAKRVAIVGIGAMGLGILEVLRKYSAVEIVAIADKDPCALNRAAYLLPNGALITTKSVEVLEKKPDILIDATTAILDAALISIRAIEQGTHVVLMNSEVDQVLGRLLAQKAIENGVILTSDAGDQYGVLARLIDDVKLMGFEVVMAGNNKGFLDKYANPTSIIYEAAKRRLSTTQCAAYTDGTKLAIEMAIIANREHLGVLGKTMMGPKISCLSEVISTFDLDKARKMGGVVDYVLGAEPGGSVFVVGYSNDPEDIFYMDYYKMGKGPYYVFVRPYHLCHFETPVAIQRIVKYHEPIVVQRNRVLEVNSYAKTDLKKGTKLDGIGGCHLYGVLEEPSGLPIGLSGRAILTRDKKKDCPIEWTDVKFLENDPLLALWKEQEEQEAHAS